MAIDKNGAGAWPTGWQEIGAVPYQLIITVPEYTWTAVAQLAGFFLAVTAVVVFATRKKFGFGWSSFVGVIAAWVVCIPMFMSIDFGPKRFEPVAPLERPKLKELEVSKSEKAQLCGDTTGKVAETFEAYCSQRRAWMDQHGHTN